jgi:hypothetical protein
MLAPQTWWDHTSQWIRMASLCSLLMHFIGVNNVDSVGGTCTFKDGRSPYNQHCWIFPWYRCSSCYLPLVPDGP